jgi:hypothetical protein
VRVSKALHFGLEEVQPGQPLTNADRIHSELMDVLGVYDMLQQAGVLPGLAIHAIDAKRAKVEKFLAYSKECGVLTD